MRISWLSNAPWAHTGYGNQTALFTPLINKVHPTAITAFYGLDGGVINWNGIPIYPKAFHPYGQDVAGANAVHFRADVMISLMDAWVCEPRLYSQHVKWVPWFPIDMTPLPPPVLEKVSGAFDRIAMSKFGVKMCREAGIDCHYVPHGVDTEKYRPIDRKEARAQMRIPDDVFLVGMVAANKGNPSRKAFTRHLEAFAMFKQKRKDAVLYLHTSESKGGEHGGVNLPEYCAFLGLEIGKDVLFCDQYQNVLGFPDDWMNILYNAFDVKMLVSMGEGFGIPIVEAQAAGCPVIVGDWTAMSELCFSGWKVSQAEAARWWTPLGAYQYDPQSAAIYERLEAAYQKRGNQKYRDMARARALEYDVRKVFADYWIPTLSLIEQKLSDTGGFAAALSNG